MTAPSLTVEVDDQITRDLARALIAAQIVGQALACFLLLEMIDRGQFTYRARWYLSQWQRQRLARREAESKFRRLYGAVLFEADLIIKDAANG